MILLSINASAYEELAFGKNTSASSTGGGFPASNAVDGSFATLWAASGAIYPSYWMVDLGANDAIDTVRLSYFPGYNYSLNITVSLDNATFTEVYTNVSYYNGLGAAFLPNITFTSVNARYVKIWLKNNPANPALTPGLTEVQIYGIPAPILITPTNLSTIYKPYPPLTTSINFTWDLNNYYDSNIIIAKDPNFNLISVDTTISNNYSVQVLEAGDYWWKVRYYDSASGTYYGWSPTSNFTLTNNYTTSGKAGVEGIIYEIIGGAETPISGALVYVYNASNSYEMMTGSNGYYLFDNLTNATTYSIYAEKTGYDTTAAFPFTTGAGTRTQHDILMKAYISPYVPNFVYEKFIVRDLFDNPYPGVTVTIYKGPDITAYLTGTTDSLGAAVFQLIKDQYYRVTFSGGGLSSTITAYVYGKEEEYLITVISGFPTTPNRNAAISANLTTSTINATHSNLSLIYSDTSGTTTGINFTVKNATTGALICLVTASANATLACTVASAGIYQFGYNATSTTYGTFSETKYINFGAGNAAAPTIPMQGTSATLLHWGSIILIVVTAALFSVKTVKFGAVVLPLEAGALWWLGWFQVNGLLMAISVVLGIMIYLRFSEGKANYQ